MSLFEIQQKDIQEIIQLFALKLDFMVMSTVYRMSSPVNKLRRGTKEYSRLILISSAGCRTRAHDIASILGGFSTLGKVNSPLLELMISYLSQS